MLRECSLEDISDGRTYGLNDMVKADTGNCQGCHKCCTGMGQSIVLDPYDIWRIKTELNQTFEMLIGAGRIELNIVDGLILPNLRMADGDRCSFLDENGRCSIHAARPGICRLFPLGRVYDGTGFDYFMQKDECVKENRVKVKVKKWIDTEHIAENQKFISAWHYFIRDIGELMQGYRRDGQGDRLHEIAMYVLNEFYVTDLICGEVPDEELENRAAIYEVLQQKIKAARQNIRVQ